MKKIIFIGLLLMGLAYGQDTGMSIVEFLDSGQDSTVTQVVERFVADMNVALDEIESFQTQIDSLEYRIILLETALINTDTSIHTVAEIDTAVAIILKSRK